MSSVNGIRLIKENVLCIRKRITNLFCLIAAFYYLFGLLERNISFLNNVFAKTGFSENWKYPIQLREKPDN
ncbi:MAG: hypothetical protein JWQ09_2211 [Segetibacter sp.]|nr:hypothetical protein [Segetibacter sp.]